MDKLKALEKKLKLLEKKREAAVKKNTELSNLDPFWNFKPTTGDITPEMRQFLSEYLNEDDIPQKVDGQLDAILSDKEIKLITGGNQAGKSNTAVIDGIIDSTGDIPFALEPYREQLKDRLVRATSKMVRGRVIAVDFKQLHNTVIPSWRQWVPRKSLKNGKWADSFSSQHNRLTLWSGKKKEAEIEFMTNQMDIDSFQGPPLDWLKCDEEPKEAIYKENLMRFVTAERLNIGMYYTPTHGLSWTADLFLEGTENIDTFKLCTVSNPRANMDAVRSIVNDQCHTYEEIKMRLLGEFISLSGLVYGSLFDRSIHVIDSEYIDNMPKDLFRDDFLTRLGVDFHLVTPAAAVFLLQDRMGNKYVDRCYFKSVDTEDFKSDISDIISDSGYRMSFSVCDKSADSSILAFGGLNIMKELRKAPNSLPALRSSEKFEGSIKAGVNEIKKDLKVNENSKKPSLYILDRPENKALIQTFRTLERDSHVNEDKKGPKDKILEGKHHLHAALRYIYQFPLNWYSPVDNVPEPLMQDADALY